MSGLNNLSPRDTILLIVIVNIVCYFLGYQIIVSPLMNAYKETNEQRIAKQAEYDNLKYEADQEPVYDETISNLKKERRDEINSKFYQTVTSEKFHKWFTNIKASEGINLSSFTIDRDAAMTTDADGNTVEADFVNNKITLVFTSTYPQLIALLKEIEDDGKSSALTSLSVTPEGEIMSTTLSYSFYSITKNDGEDASFASGKLDLGGVKPNPESQVGNISLGTISG